jgi:hypothetical protein
MVQRDLQRKKTWYKWMAMGETEYIIKENMTQ